MFRCKVCGWIHEGATPPDICPSCGSPADRFRPMDNAEVTSQIAQLSTAPAAKLARVFGAYGNAA